MLYNLSTIERLSSSLCTVEPLNKGHIGTSHFVHYSSSLCTVEPLNKGHIGTSHFVHYEEVVLFLEVSKCIIAMGNDNFGT